MSRIQDLAVTGLRFVRYRAWQYPGIGRAHRRRVEAVANRGHARVVFLAMSVALWKYQRLYDAMAADRRFTATIVLSPTIAFHADQRWRDVEALRRHFDRLGVDYIDYDCDSGGAADIRVLDPDIIFYPQPYERLLIPEHDCTNFYDRLLCYYPYSFMTGEDKLTYNYHFHNLAWRLYYPNEEIRQVARRLMTNKGRNVRVVGHPNGDDFAAWDGHSPWKEIGDGRPRARIVWAPHFTVTAKFGRIARGNFLWMAHFMLDIAQRYREFVQIAFKPHPRLLTELYAHHEWGKERTDSYFAMWRDMENTQLETGQYVDLFMSSDALIHDSASFVVEYLYTLKPVMYVSREIDTLLANESSLSREAFAQLYIGRDEREIMDFVDRVVLGREDPMRPGREDFFRRHLAPPGGKTAAQVTIDDLLASLCLG